MKPRLLALCAALLIAPLHAQTTQEEIQADLLGNQIIGALQAQDYSKAAGLYEQYDALGVAMPPPLQLQRALTYFRLERYLESETQLRAYLMRAERGSDGYQQAIQMLAEVTPLVSPEERQAEAKAEAKRKQAAIAKLTPKCNTPTKKGDAACYIKVTNHANCYIWNPYPADNESYEWSGQCNNFRPDGHGEETWSFADGESGGTGSYRDGKKHGDWVDRSAHGTVYEGPYRNGKKHGHWVWRSASGTVWEGSYLNDKMHGHSVVRRDDGFVMEGSYLNDKRNGKWVMRWADGDVKEGPYQDGKRHGHWVERFANGNLYEGQYVNGNQHGKWVKRKPNGYKGCTTFIHGERQDIYRDFKC